MRFLKNRNCVRYYEVEIGGIIVTINFDNNEHNEGDERPITDERRKKLIELLRNGVDNELMCGLHPHDLSDAKVYTMIHRDPDYQITVRKELGVVELYWRGLNYYIYNSFNCSDTISNINGKAHEIANTLISLEVF